MPGLSLLIPLALLLGFTGLLAFFWSMKSGQYDDLDGASMRILIDDEDRPGEDRPGEEWPGEEWPGEDIPPDNSAS